MTAPHSEWLHRAEDDLSFAQLGFRNSYFSQVCFLAQQVCEKALKAVLIRQAGDHPRVHKLVELANRCAHHLDMDDSILDRLRILDQYYIPCRYPDGVPGDLSEGSPSAAHAEEALETAELILGVCREAIARDGQ